MIMAGEKVDEQSAIAMVEDEVWLRTRAVE
jgi:hypothetical protein